MKQHGVHPRHRVEIFAAQVGADFNIEKRLDEERIRADYKQGILTITMPKRFDLNKLGFSSGIKGSTDSSKVTYNVNDEVDGIKAIELVQEGAPFANTQIYEFLLKQGERN